MTTKEMLRAQYRLLGHKETEYTEFRLIQYPRGQVTVGWAKGENSFVLKALEYIQVKDQMVFVGLNPRKLDTHGDLNNIANCNVIMIDVDPIRPVGEPSTDEQHKRALDRGFGILNDIPNSILVDSGSGCHVYIPIDPIPVEDPKTLTKQLSKYHAELRQKYEQDGLKIDATFDLPRVTRLWGSFNPKSKRYCKPVSSWDMTSPLPRTKLELPSLEETPIAIKDYNGNYPRLDALVKNNLQLKNILEGKGDYISPSEANYALVNTLVKAQFDTDSIKHIVLNAPYAKQSLKDNEQLEKDVDRIIEKARDNGIGSVSMLHSSEKYLKGLESRKPGYMTGFKQLDEKLAGLQKARLYVLAARTNEGKTSFACNLAYNLIKENISVLYFPTELGYEPLFDKIVSQATEIPLKKFQFGNFLPQETSKIKSELQVLQKFPFIVVEDFALVLDTINRKANEIRPEVIIIDYVQAIKFEEGGVPHEISDLVRGLKELNEKLNVPIILCSQLNRGAIGNELSLSQLKGSGAIEEFSDVVMALSTLSKFEYPRPVDLHILKSRYSEIGRVKFNFYSSIGKFEEKLND